jgi:hypothetical protein
MATPYPKLVASLTHMHDAWVVGSAADPGNEKPRDWDVMVPFSQWNAASQLIPKDAKPNTFGGWKVKTEEGDEIDVWPGELGVLMQNAKARYAWHVRTGTRLLVQRDSQ